MGSINLRPSPTTVRALLVSRLRRIPSQARPGVTFGLDAQRLAAQRRTDHHKRCAVQRTRSAYFAARLCRAHGTMRTPNVTPGRAWLGMRRSRDTSSALTVVGDGLRLIEPIQITEWTPMGQRKKFHLPGNKSPNPEFLNQKRPGPPAQSAVGPRCVLTRPRCSFRRCVPGTGAGNHRGEAWERNLYYGLLAPGFF